MRARDLRELTKAELEQHMGECRKDIEFFRRQLATGVVENTRLARAARRDIARIKTILRERDLAGTAAAASE